MSTVTSEELKSLNRAVLMRYGIDFRNYEPRSFGRRITKVMKKFNIDNVTQLWMKVLREPDFIYLFIDNITVGLTELFRNPNLWVDLRDEILPSFPKSQTLNIWHAGCSTGEEVYSMGILLHEAHQQYRVKGMATDINRGAVEQAGGGWYEDHFYRKYSKNYQGFSSQKDLDDYITKREDGKFFFDPGLKSHLKFGLHNLVTDTVEDKFDIIFCRNVMIYFDKTLQERILQKFWDALNEGGYLVIGYYDSNPNNFGDLFEVKNSATKIYQKKIKYIPKLLVS